MGVLGLDSGFRGHLGWIMASRSSSIIMLFSSSNKLPGAEQETPRKTNPTVQLFNLISFLKPPGLDSGLLALPGLDSCSQVAARGRAGNPKENKPYSQFSSVVQFDQLPGTSWAGFLARISLRGLDSWLPNRCQGESRDPPQKNKPYSQFSCSI